MNDGKRRTLNYLRNRSRKQWHALAHASQLEENKLNHLDLWDLEKRNFQNMQISLYYCENDRVHLYQWLYIRCTWHPVRIHESSKLFHTQGLRSSGPRLYHLWLQRFAKYELLNTYFMLSKYLIFHKTLDNDTIHKIW